MRGDRFIVTGIIIFFLFWNDYPNGEIDNLL